MLSAGVQSPYESRELRGGGGSQPLEPVLLLRERRKRLPDEPVKLSELILATRLPAKSPSRVIPKERGALGRSPSE